MNFSSFFYDQFRYFLFIMLVASSVIKAERALFYRSDDGRAQQLVDNRILTHADLGKYKSFSPTWQPHGAGRGNKQQEPRVISDTSYSLPSEELRQTIQMGVIFEINRHLRGQPAWIDDDTRIFYEDDQAYDNSRFIKRAQAEIACKPCRMVYSKQLYKLSKEANILLLRLGIWRDEFNSCFGNQLQHVIHRECVDLVERVTQLKPDSPIFQYQFALGYCITAAQSYNKMGQTYHATVIADFCWTLLDYGKAVLEGARDGLVSAVQQALNDPLQTVASATLSVAAGEYMLAYQLGKIVYSILNFTVNALINPEQEQKTWDGYIAPISSLIDELKNKQISFRNGIRAGTALAVSMKAQSMLAKGCEKLYSVAKTRALTYLAKNPLSHPEQYMEGCDGFAFKVAGDNKIEWAKHYRKHIPPKGVDWKTIVKETRHGPARYKHGLDIENFELTAWKKGIPVTNGKTWKVMKADSIIGAVSGVETPYVRIEMSANTIHGHPITLEEYRSLLK